MEEIRIGPDDAGQRLDRFVRKYLKGASLPTVYKLIRTKQVRLNGRKARPERRLAEGDMLLLHFAERRMRDLRGEARKDRDVAAPSLDVVFEDEHLLAVAKPPFLLVHEGRDGDEPTLEDGIAAYLGPSEAKTFRPGLAHRLDRLTSGVVLVGKTAEALRGLMRAFRQSRVEKVYLALAVGEAAEDAGMVEVPLRRDERLEADRPVVRVDGREGKRAATAWRVLGRRPDLTLFEVRPRTGRTHQIRVHLRHIGHPVVGDPTYGNAEVNKRMRGRHGLWRQWLHALRVGFVHPVTGTRLTISAPLPEDLLRVLDGEGFPRGMLPPDAVGP